MALKENINEYCHLLIKQMIVNHTKTIEMNTIDSMLNHRA